LLAICSFNLNKWRLVRDTSRTFKKFFKSKTLPDNCLEIEHIIVRNQLNIIKTKFKNYKNEILNSSIDIEWLRQNRLEIIYNNNDDSELLDKV
jgi:hypothetical protein